MKKRNIGFLGIARSGFDTELGFRQFQRSLSLIEGLDTSPMCPEALVTDPEEAGKFAAQCRSQAVDAFIAQFVTFADGRFISRIADELAVPILVWAVPEPEVGGRLRLNSLTGANLACSILARLQRKFRYLYRAPDSSETGPQLLKWLAAAETLVKLRKSTIAEVGNPPPGFYTSSVDPIEFMRKIGPKVVHVDLGQTFRQAANIPFAQWNETLEKDRGRVHGLGDLPTSQASKSIQIYLALKEACDTLQFSAVAVRCWPECFAEYGGAACSALSHLIDDGVPAACEADVLGAATMLIQYYLTGQPTYLGDLVFVNPAGNTSVFWHCGVGAFSLASERTGPVSGVHPVRKMGFALNNSLKSGPVTIARLGQAPGGYRMLIVKAEALDEPNQFQGTSVVIRPDKPVQEMLDAVMYGGFEHHFALVWKDVVEELVQLCQLLDIPYTLI